MKTYTTYGRLSLLMLLLLIYSGFLGFTTRAWGSAGVSITATDPLAREPYDYPDGNGGTIKNINNGEFTVFCDTTAPVEVSVNFTGAANQSGGNGIVQDYQIEYPDGPLVFNSSGSKRIRIVPQPDALCEPTEDVIATIAPSAQYMIFGTNAIVYIKNGPYSASVGSNPPEKVGEGSPLVFKIVKTCDPVNPPNIPSLPPDPDDGPNADSDQVFYTVERGTATPGLDYPPPAGAHLDGDGAIRGFASFNGGDTAYVTVVPNVDCLTEGPETVVISLEPNGATLPVEHSGTKEIDDFVPPPTVSITSPSDGATFPAGSGVTINATVNAGCETITDVAFYEGNVLLGEDTTTPYSFSWSGISGGTYTLKAVATTSTGLVGFSAPVTIQVGSSCTNNVPYLSNPQISSNTFSFSANGFTNATWIVYASQDLTNWTSSGFVTAGGGGSNSFSDTNITGVDYRFYKMSNGCCSQPIGFVRVLVGAGTVSIPGTNALIVNQLDSFAGNTLDGLFNVGGSGAMPDGTPLQDGSVIEKWNVGSQSYTDYTWNSASGWRDPSGNPAGSVTMNPGDATFLATSNAVRVTFVGLVEEGNLDIALPEPTADAYDYHIGAMIPIAGGIQTGLGVVPHGGDIVYTWNGAGFDMHQFLNFGGPHWNPNEPVLNLGQGFIWRGGTSNVWHMSYSACP